MPCTDGGPEPPRSRLEKSGKDPKPPSELRRAGKTLGPSKLEPLLCSACRVLEQHGYDFKQNPALDEWWQGHKKQDQEREIDELREQRQREYVKLLLSKPVGDLENDELNFLREQGEL